MNKCCICKENIDYHKMYSKWMPQTDGKARVYSGHKRCLFVVEEKLRSGKEIPYEEINLNIE